jgi:hypothetical protein
MGRKANQEGGMNLFAKSINGPPLMIVFDDKGTSVPGYDNDGNKHECYTSWFRVIQEGFTQVSVSDVAKSKDGQRTRMVADAKLLNSMGVDLYTVREEGGDRNHRFFSDDIIDEAI